VKLKETDLILSGVKYVTIDDKINRIIQFPDKLVKISNNSKTALALDKLFILRFGLTFGHLYNRSIIENNNIRFCDQLCLHEDHLFFFDYLLHISCIYLRPQIEYCYVNDPSVISLSHNKKKTFEELYSAYRLLSASLLLFLKKNKIEKYLNQYRLINNFIIHILIKAIVASYQKKRTDEEHLNILKLYRRLNIFRFYRPSTLMGWGLFFCFLLMPLRVLHFTLKRV